MASLKGGYDCDFVEPPPKRLECTICLLVVRDPHVISCCGNHFCRPCMERVQRDKKPCPLCNASDYTVFFHKGVTREVNDLRVHCPQKELGCLWDGELGELERHLEDAGGKGCGFVVVECAYKCGGRFLRSAIGEHESKACVSRPVEVVMAEILKKLDELSAENQAIKEENQTIKDENKMIKEENEHLKNQMIATRAQVTQLEDSIAGVSQHTDEEFRQLNSSLESKAEIEEEFSRLKTEFVDLDGLKHVVKGILDIMATKEEVAQLKTEFVDLDGLKHVVKGILDIMATKEEFARLKTEFTEFKDHLPTLAKVIQDYMATKEEFARLKTELTQLKDRVATLSSTSPVYVGGRRGF